MKLNLNTTQAVELAEEQSVKLVENSRIKVNSNPTFEKAKAQLIEAKAIGKFVKEKKESITKPLNEALKNTRLLFSPVEEKIETITKYLKDQMMTYNNKLLAEQRERELEAERLIEAEEEKKRKAEEEAEKLKEKKELTEEEEEQLKKLEEEANKEVNFDAATKKLNNTATKIDKIRTMKVKKFRIVDESLIPREYLIVNEILIKAAMRNDQKIAGVEFYTDEVPVNSY